MENFGRYQLLKLIATGGMAQIFLARMSGMVGFEKLMVVKRILPHLASNEEFVRMFLDEARIAARLNHPNIVQIFDLGAQNDSYFIAMEYIHGEDARRVWKEAKEREIPIPVPLACRMVIEACAGLDYAHKKADAAGRPLNIVHRDVSPQNLIVTFEGGVKVVDFGIAKASNQMAVTRSGVLKGKYAYMSPEQAQGKVVDARTDIFALGVILFELLTGRRLFRKSNDLQTLAAVNDCRVPPPSDWNPAVPKSLDAIVLKALKREPSERFADAQGLQLALEQWLVDSGQPGTHAHLAAFMRQLYSRRLAREAAEGQVFFDEDEEDASEDLSPRADSEGQNPQDAKQKPDSTEALNGPEPYEEFTLTQSAQSSEVDSRAGKTARDRPLRPKTLPSRWKTWAAIAVVVSAVLFLVWPRKPVPVPASVWAEVHLATRPEKAGVEFAGAVLKSTTPLVLPRVAAGRYPIRVFKEGFETYLAEVEVPENGRVFLPLIDLTPSAERAQALRKAQVTLRIETEPLGASVFVDGVLRGASPVEVQVAPNAPVGLRVELAGYIDEVKVFSVGKSSNQREKIVLKKAVRNKPAKVRGRPPIKEEERSEGGNGLVRFVASPWAEVECNGSTFGQTPFPPRLMASGEYLCKFHHPELGTKVKRVLVRANQKMVVSVKF